MVECRCNRQIWNEETIVRRDHETEPGRADTDKVLLRDRRRGSEGGDLVMRVWLAPQDPGLAVMVCD